MSEEIKVTIINTHKDRLFKIIFNEKKKLLSLYNALADTEYTDENQLEVNTLEDALYISMKNDLSFILDGRMNIFEQQSSINPNMPLRGLFYISDLYKIKYSGSKLYSSKLIKIPTPQYIVLYNGTDQYPDRKDLRLSEAFEHKTDNPDVEVIAHMININIGHNNDLMEKCRDLYEYSTFIDRIRENIKAGMDKKKAIENAIESCIRDGILSELLKKEKVKVMASVLSEFNEVDYAKMIREEGIEQGRSEGLEQGRSEGLEQGMEKINILNQKLIMDKRNDDLLRSFKDKEFQKKLLEEYNIY